MHQNGKSLFIISLDFELLWGVRDKRTIETYGENLRGVRKVIPSLLRLFDAYGIHATFATVGFLFARNKQELTSYIPSILPVYSQKKYSPYENNCFSGIGNTEEDDIYHYASSLIQMIRQHPEHEIATHTFSHYYCLEKASLASFEADLMAAKNIASTYGVALQSIVFPRNQYSEEHIAVCKKLGFIAYRGNEKAPLYNPRENQALNKGIRATRLADSYLNVTGHHTFTMINEGGIVNIPSSRFLRPFSPKLTFLERLRLKRIKDSMTVAAKNNECYHLWWHPHNFGKNIEENLQFLEAILKQYRHLNQAYGMQSQSMKEIAQGILQDYGI